jgi:hypothetical protein
MSLRGRWYSNVEKVARYAVDKGQRFSSRPSVFLQRHHHHRRPHVSIALSISFLDCFSMSPFSFLYRLGDNHASAFSEALAYTRS